MCGQNNCATPTISIIPKILNTIPYVAIVLTETTPELIAIALGGVAIGSMKAYEAQIVATIMMSVASIPVCSATLYSIGSMIDISAVLLVISVVKVTIVAMISKKRIVGMVARVIRCEAISAAIPVFVTAAAIANPAPKRNMIR